MGAGKMGSALLEGWLRLGLAPNRVAVIEPSPSPDVAALAKRGLSLNPDLPTLRDAAVVVLAVKPQIAAEAIAPLRAIVGAGTLVISIMAGRTLRFLASALEQAGALVRARDAESPRRDRARHHGCGAGARQRRAAAACRKSVRRHRRGRVGRR